MFIEGANGAISEFGENSHTVVIYSFFFMRVYKHVIGNEQQQMDES